MSYSVAAISRAEALRIVIGRFRSTQCRICLYRPWKRPGPLEFRRRYPTFCGCARGMLTWRTYVGRFSFIFGATRAMKEGHQSVYDCQTVWSRSQGHIENIHLHRTDTTRLHVITSHARQILGPDHWGINSAYMKLSSLRLRSAGRSTPEANFHFFTLAKPEKPPPYASLTIGNPPGLCAAKNTAAKIGWHTHHNASRICIIA